jgi:hypothetical protein
MRKFIPVEPFTRVSFAAPGAADLVVVETSGLVLPETETQTQNVWNDESQKYEEQQVEVPINGDLFHALEAHIHVREVPVSGGTPPAPPTPPQQPAGDGDDPKE